MEVPLPQGMSSRDIPMGYSMKEADISGLDPW
jgi:hypothetical protein